MARMGIKQMLLMQKGGTPLVFLLGQGIAGGETIQAAPSGPCLHLCATSGLLLQVLLCLQAHPPPCKAN